MQQDTVGYALGAGAADSADPNTVAAETIRALTSLLAEVKQLVGDSASRALYARSLHLARASFQRPETDVDSVGALLAPLQQDLAARESADARHAARQLLQAFVDLLVALIGKPLTHRMLRTAWAVPATEILSEENLR